MRFRLLRNGRFGFVRLDLLWSYERLVLLRASLLLRSAVRNQTGLRSSKPVLLRICKQGYSRRSKRFGPFPGRGCRHDQPGRKHASSPRAEKGNLELVCEGVTVGRFSNKK